MASHYSTSCQTYCCQPASASLGNVSFHAHRPSSRAAMLAPLSFLQLLVASPSFPSTDLSQVETCAGLLIAHQPGTAVTGLFMDCWFCCQSMQFWHFSCQRASKSSHQFSCATIYDTAGWMCMAAYCQAAVQQAVPDMLPSTIY